MSRPKQEPGFFEQVFDVLKDELNKRLPVTRAEVPSVATACVGRMIEHFGGEQIYLPKEKGAFIRGRNEEIIAAFNGVNYRELARRFGLTERSIRKIVNEKS